MSTTSHTESVRQMHDIARSRGVRILGALALVVSLGAALLAPASALGVHQFLETFGSAEQPSFLKAQALAVDPISSDLHVADVGVNEVQSVTVSAAAGQFKLKFEGETTANINFNAPAAPEAGSVQAALRALPSIGPTGVGVSGGPGNAAGSNPYLVTFRGTLATTDVEQLVCENGTTPLSGGSGCSVSTTTAGIASKVERFNPDGTPNAFSSLGTNMLDELVLNDNPNQNQIAIDNGAGVTDGDIYVNQPGRQLIAVFSGDGNQLGDVAEWTGGGFGEPCGVAVDDTGALYISDFSLTPKIHKYVPLTNPPVKADNTANFTSPGGAFSPCSIAAGSGATEGFIFVKRNVGDMFKLDSSTGELKYEIGSGGFTTVTVDPSTGHVYGAKGSEVIEYDASGVSEETVVSSFTVPSTVTGIAVEASGRVYVARAGNAQIEVWIPVTTPDVVTEPPDPVGATGATLKGTVDPNGLPLTACFFEWGETESYGEIAPCVDPDFEEVGTGTSPVEVHADISGLKEGTDYHVRLVAENANGAGKGSDVEFTTLGPAIRAGSVSQITATGARVNAEIDPNGKATSFQVQYVTDAKFQETGFDEAETAPASPKAVGSGEGFTPVTQLLSGLTPDTAYHLRIVASNADASVEGPDKTFTTAALAGGGLPNGRAYEMVSPPQKVGEPFPPEPAELFAGTCPVGSGSGCLPGIGLPMAPMQARPDGEAVVYEGQPFGGGMASQTNEYLGARSASGWSTDPLSEPLFGSSESQGFKAFSEDLSRAIVYQIEPALTPDAPSSEGKGFANLYLWQEGALEPLVSEEPPERDPGFQGENRFRIVYGGANAGSEAVPAFTHIAFAANDALTEASAFAPEAPEVPEGEACGLTGTAGEDCNLYEWAEGELRLLNVLPGNASVAGGAVIGSRPVGNEAAAVDNAVSNDGRTIFWSDGTGQLYARIDGEDTLKIDDPGPPDRFLMASTDGSQVLLGDGCLYDLEAEACEDLSEGEGGFEGILGASEDLSSVYFIDSAALTEESEENDNGEHAEDGEFNLYRFEEGESGFIAQLVEADNKVAVTFPEIGTWKPSSTRRTAQVSPEGRYLAFMSKAPLTGQDSSVAGGGNCRFSTAPACYEVFAYDALTGELSCPSCNPTGEAPLGGANLSLIKELVPSPIAPLPAPHNLTTEGEGRLFFESRDTLSPQDTNGKTQDVYQWEPEGVGGCERAGGCLALISSGRSATDSQFLNSTPSGDDAFFITRERLLPRDKDERLDLYDARAPHVPGEAVGFPEGGITPCAGEACKGPLLSPPLLPSAGSSTFSGPGNLTPRKPRRCAKGKLRRKGRCVARRRARRQGKQRRLAGPDRRAAG